MSTKKRLFIISMIYVAFAMFLFLLLLIGVKTFLTDINFALSLVYSLLIVVFYFGIGLATRLLSCKGTVLLISFIEAMLLLTFSICFFNVYPSANIYLLNAGDSTYLTPGKDIGLSYFLYSAFVFLLGYYITHFIIKVKDYFKVRKLCNELSESSRQQIRINNVYILKNYNKLTNKYERYLIWKTKKGTLQSSEKLLYYDNVELVAIDAKKNIYAMIEVPTKINIKQYIEIMHQN